MPNPAQPTPPQLLANGQAKQLLAAIVESSDDAILAKTPEGIVTFWNRAAERLYQYSAEEAIGKPVSFIIPPDRPDEFPAIMDRLRQGEVIDHFETQRMRKDGACLDVSVTISPVRDQSGVIIGASAITRDVTEAKRQRTLLAQRERELQTLTDNVPDVICRFDRDLRITFVNPAVTRRRGMKQEEIVGKTNDELGLPEDPAQREQWTDAIRSVFQSGREMEYQSSIETPGGSFHFHTRIVPERGDDGNVESVLSVSRDISALVNTERALQHREQQLATTLRSIGDAVVSTDEAGLIVFMNPVAEELTGWPDADARGRHIYEVFRIINEHTRKAAPNPVDRVIRKGVVVGLANNTLLISRDGIERPIDDSAAPIKANDGRFLGVVLVFRDIGKRREVQRTQRILAEAGQILAASLDYDSTLRNVAHLLVRTLADWCAIDIVNQSGDLHRVATAHPDPAMVSLVEEMDRKYPSRKDAPVGPYNVLRTGKPEMMSDISDEVLERNAIDDEHYRILKGLGFRSYICVPMEARGKMLGVLTLISSGSARRYREEDVILAEEVGRRAAIAVDNAVLYREAQNSAAEVAELNVRLQRAMSETHHRVKNNLQIISALVDMQTLQFEQAVPVSQLKRLEQHIRALAAIHDLLTQQTRGDLDTDQISVAAALDRLLPMMQEMSEHRRIRFNVTDVRLPVRQGTSLVVLVNELISNALKHGAGDIELSFAPAGSHARLEVTDCGDGFPSEFDAQGISSTGIELIRSLAQWDLRGSVHFENSPEGGARVTVEFPLPESGG